MEKLNIEFAYAACCLFCALAGAAFDVVSRRIPNAFTLPAMVFGLLLHLSLGGWGEMARAALGGMVCGLIFLLFFVAGGMGGGDVKLITAAGCTAGLTLVGPLLFLTALAGGVMGVCLALYRGRLKQTIANLWVLTIHHSTAGLVPHHDVNLDNPQALRLPYAVAIAAGTALTLCQLVLR
jgi:prepilin peptidase CpaA